MTPRDSIFGAALVILAALAPAAAKEWPRIRIASEGGHPPFNVLDDMGRLQGFEIDLARAACERLHATCEFMTQDFQGLIPALIAGRFDAIVSSLSITDHRRAHIAFSVKYYETPSLFVVSKRDGGMSVGPEAMRGKTVGAKIASTNARFLEAVYAPAGVTVRLYHTHDEARLDLAEGRIDAILGDKAPLLYWLEKSVEGRCCQVVGQDLRDPKFFGEGIGIGVRKTDVDLKALFDRAIGEIRADGTYDAIRARYFPYDVY